MFKTMGEYGCPIGVFTPSQVEAINDTTDIQLTFAVHGALIAGTSHYMGVNDHDYAVAARVVDQLDPARDALAVELIDSAAKPEGAVQQSLDRLRLDADFAEVADNTQLLGLARTERRLTTFRYAAGLALERGIPTHYADAPYDIDNTSFFEALVRRYPNVLARSFKHEKLMRRERDFWAVQAIGDVALGMAQDESVTGRHSLAVLRGYKHQKDTEAILRHNGINFTSQVVRHSLLTDMRLIGEAVASVRCAS